MYSYLKSRLHGQSEATLSYDSRLIPSQPLGKPQVNKTKFIYLALAFALLEAGFVMLACICLIKPIPINPPSYISTSEAKAVTTLVAVVWHAFAAFPIRDIISLVFSAECMAQHCRTSRLEPEDTDRVSCITTGLLAHTQFFLTKLPTPPYRLAFALIILIMILGPVGSSVIVLGDSGSTHHQDMPIANLTMTESFAFFPQRLCSSRTQRILEMEILDDVPFGYETDNDKMLVPWPQPDTKSGQGAITYETDIVKYDYNCQWSEFTLFLESQRVWSVRLANNSEWSPWAGNSGNDLYFISILPLVEGSEAATPLGEPDKHPNPSSAFAFTTSSDDDTFDLPSTNTTVSAPDMALDWDPRRLRTSVLFCETQYTTHRARVTLSGGRLNATILQSLPLIGNFPELATNAVINQGLLYSLAPEPDANPNMGPIATRAFLEPREPNSTELRKLLPLSDINQNMNDVLKKAAKGYLNGYKCKGNVEALLSPEYTHINQTVTVQYQQNSLVSSRPFLVSLVVLYAITVLVLGVLLMIVDVERMRLFNLRTLENIYGECQTTTAEKRSFDSVESDSSVSV